MLVPANFTFLITFNIQALRRTTSDDERKMFSIMNEKEEKGNSL